MIKAIFFDFDGVLTTDPNGTTSTCKNIQKVVPHIPFEVVYRCYRAQHEPILLGEKTNADIWPDFCSCVGQDISFAILPDALKNPPQNEPMFALARSLHKRYTTGIITDNGAERFAVLVPAMQLDAIFPARILSAEVGSKKNEPCIFEAALKAADCTAEECVFIDNYQDNLLVPAKMGFKTFWHDHEKNDLLPLIQQLEEWGVIL